MVVVIFIIDIMSQCKLFEMELLIMFQEVMVLAHLFAHILSQVGGGTTNHHLVVDVMLIRLQPNFESNI